MSTFGETRRAGSSPGASGATEHSRQAVGILNIDKPMGLTSHDVVDRVRRLSGQRRVGHAGTLDPMATGVLVVCLGKATRLAEYVAEGSKSYLATIHFGVITDTWDADGRIVETRECGRLSLDAIEHALASFKGRIDQVPPMYSAIKRDGQPLYRLARQGITLRREPRLVEIYGLEIEGWHPPELDLRVDCSKGTYIRSLAHDLGEAVSAGAHLSNLTRLAVGRFRREDAVNLPCLLGESANGRWERHLLPMEVALQHMPNITVDLSTARRISHGQAVCLQVQGGTDICCAFAAQPGKGEPELLAILKRGQKADLWRPHKVLAAF